MITSMTGYGRSLKENGDSQLTVEMRAVNHRFCEINVRMPKQLFFMEDQIKKLITRYVRRGKVDVFINLNGEGTANRTLMVDWELFHQYHKTFERMAESYVTSKAFPVDQLLLNENVVEIKEATDVSEDLQNLTLLATEEACQQLVSMRKREGQELYEDLKNRINKMNNWAKELKEYAPTVQNSYRERLSKRVREFIDGSLNIDETRILTEVAIYADKSDIQEELTRIESHVKQFGQILEEDDVVGRKLDFIVQELNRESNTIGSKANDISISQTVVQMKSELEKIREQVQNVE
ncbi:MULTISPECIES: YicC/YloC family endoribonuclease [Bacillaceae]|uniref:YicC family protein n=1 Tax=Evansella alkalicola TaxID=745819 RepID=A0ABS6JPB4_9BACI|nr:MULTISPECIES: YicC/YloC family endoribonuclease [Bacillaceae]MBU9720407.1 YicC family protein [Bacillus alkalicola]